MWDVYDGTIGPGESPRIGRQISQPLDGRVLWVPGDICHRTPILLGNSNMISVESRFAGQDDHIIPNTDTRGERQGLFAMLTIPWALGAQRHSRKRSAALLRP
jgi:hypothetical protein